MDFGAGVRKLSLGAFAISSFLLAGAAVPAAAQNAKPNIVMLMTDDTGWNDFGAYSGGAQPSAIPHPTSTRWPKKAPSSPVGTARQAAQPVVPRLSPDAFRSALLYRSWLPPATKTISALRPRPSPNSSRRTATPRTSPVSGTSATSLWPTQPIMASTR